LPPTVRRAPDSPREAPAGKRSRRQAEARFEIPKNFVEEIAREFDAQPSFVQTAEPKHLERFSIWIRHTHKGE